MWFSFYSRFHFCGVNIAHIYIYIAIYHHPRKNAVDVFSLHLIALKCYAKSGSAAVGPPELVLSDSLLPPVFAGSQDDTLLPLSPSQLLHTNVAQETLRSVDNHDSIVQKEAGKSYTLEMIYKCKAYI